MAWWDAGKHRVVGTCLVCEVPMLSKHAWRQGVRRDGHASHGGRGLCHTHYTRLRRHGDPQVVLKPVGRGSTAAQAAKRSLDEVLEEYAMIRDDVDSVAEAARRMGMTFSALDRALYRARQQGLTGALPPPPQVDRAIRRGQATYLRRAS